ncbi:methylisocitrate lyase [Candidatus Marinamargulisbacteria bacterium SCGC AG-414-C22]|nr:methylisocitrate lyase [Candidatus Marinamargulisbacteria bacterium SCGC AG-414-C22]
MIDRSLDSASKRLSLKKLLQSGHCLQFPGALSALSGLMIQKKDFDGVYISGAMIANQLGYPDTGLTTLTEVAHQGNAIANAVSLPCIIDADTGFGNEDQCVRTIMTLEEAGLAGCHIEDQVYPKRCGHLNHKKLISTKEMVAKIAACVHARKDSNFLIIARCDANHVEGFDAMIERSKAYVDAGADVIFLEALETLDEYKVARNEINAFLLANCTEFGKTPLFNYKTFSNMGYNIVIYPLTLQRLCMNSIAEGLDHLKRVGDMKSMLTQMQTRTDLYDLLNYQPEGDDET